ncbi:MAG: acyltransferase family protein [Marinicella sp.]
MKYRKEIDGLRAIAVIQVILFHSGLSLFSGGFIGVDVFFVISGFLITTLLTDEIKQNKFSLTRFYIRRANRLLPALFVVLLFTTVLAGIFLNPNSFKDYSLSLINVNTFTSNFYFLFNSGYFASDAIELPLLHTWTLAVEEQFYLLFPLFLAAVGVKAKNKVLRWLILISVISFSIALYLQAKHLVYANFYLIFSRAWELLLGAMLVFIDGNSIEKKLPLVMRKLLAWLGLFMILVAGMILSEDSPFPGWLTLLPVLGTAMIIFFISDNSLLSKVLSFKWLVFVGLISYSLYLWHHPILSFINLRSVGNPTQIMVLLGVILSFVLAYLSWQFVEKPFRSSGQKSKSHFRAFAAVSFLLLLLGSWGYFTDGAPQRFYNNAYASTLTKSPIKTTCHAKESNVIPPKESCRYFGEEITWAALGDSHVAEPAYVLAKKLEPRDQGILHLSFGNCPPAFQLELVSPVGCSQWTTDAIDLIIQDPVIEHVVIAYRYSKYLFGRNKPTYPELPAGSPKKLFDSSLNINPERAREQIWMGLKSMIETLNQAGKIVYVVYPIPELPVDINEAIFPDSVFSDSTAFDLNKTVTKEYYFKRNEFIINKLNTLAYDHNLIAIKPFSIFCSDGFCPAILDENALYFDSNHLSLKGAEILIRSIKFVEP